MDDEINWDDATNMREMNAKRIIPREAKIDREVSKILGKPVLVNDYRLIQLVVKHKKQHGNSPDADKMDNYLYNPEFLDELRKTFA